MATITDLLGELLDTLEGAVRLYNRNAAVRYARKYWESVPSDGMICLGGDTTADLGGNYTWIKGANGARYYHPEYSATELAAVQALEPELGEPLPDNLAGRTEIVVVPSTATPCDNEGRPGPLKSRLIPFRPLDDCTHFVSCCIGDERHERGGGVAVARDFPSPDAPYGKVAAQGLLKSLLSKGQATALGSPNPNADVPPPTRDRSVIRQLRRGDLIFYMFRNSTDYHHSAILLTDGTDPEPQIACHSYSRGLRADMPDDHTAEWSPGWTFADADPGYCFVHITNIQPEAAKPKPTP